MDRVLKASWLVIIAMVATSIAVIWILSTQVLSEQKDLNNKVAERELNMVRESLLLDVEQTSDRLATLIEKEFKTPTEIQDLQASDFEAVGVISKSELTWHLDWWETKEMALEKSRIETELMQWPLEGMEQDETAWLLTRTQMGRVFIVLIRTLQTKQDGKVLRGFGIMPLTHFSRVMAQYKSANDKMMFVDGVGNVFAHPEQPLVGGKALSEGLVNSLHKNPTSFKTGVSRSSAQEPVFGGFVKIPKTNLFAVFSTPQDSMPMLVQKFAVQSAVVVLGLMLIFIVLSYLINKKAITDQEILLRNLELERKKEVPVTITPATPTKDRRSYTTATARILKTPTHALLGLAQMLKQDVQSPQAQQRLTNLENEARSIRDFVDELCVHENVSDLKREVVDVGALTEQLKLVLAKGATDKKIIFEENLKVSGIIRGDFNECKEAMKAIFQALLEKAFGGQKTAGVPQKYIFNSEKVGGMVRFVAEIQGIRFDKDTRKDFFKPFKVLYSGDSTQGLGLPLAKSIIDQHQGEVTVEDLNQNGLRVSILIPLVSQTGVQATAFESSKVTEVMGKKPVDEDDMFPPVPSETTTDVNIAQEVRSETVTNTKSSASALSIKIDGLDLSQPTKNDAPPSISIRKPKVRTD